MATYPGAIPAIPDDGTWSHGMVEDELTAALTELGVHPSGSQADVAARFGAAETRLSNVEANQVDQTLGGIELQSAQLVANWDFKAGGTTLTDVGLTIAVPAQTRAYNVWFNATVNIGVTGSLTAGTVKYQGVVFRIVDSGVTQVLRATQFPFVLLGTGQTQNLYIEALMYGRVPAGQPATTWKVQGRSSNTIAAEVSTFAIFAQPVFGTPTAGVQANPAQLQAITV